MKYKNHTIYKRTNCNTWYTKLRIDGKQICISAKTQQECLAKLKECIKTKQENDNLTLKCKFYKWVEKWKSIYKTETSIRTKQDTEYNLNKYIYPHFKNKEIKSITSIEIMELINNLNGDRTKKKAYVLLNDIFDKALKNEIITKNPMNVVIAPKYKAPEKEIIPEDKEKVFIENCKKYDEGKAILFALYQGVGPKELLGIKLEDIDFKNNILHIKGTKNEYRDRKMPLFAKTKELIKDINTKYLFYKNADRLNNVLRRIIKESDIKEKISMYNLRHTFISRCMMKNIPEVIIQQWVGHVKGSSITKQVYTHVEDDYSKYINI